MSNQDVYDAGFTEGYARGIEGRPRAMRMPMELILLAPEKVPVFYSAYEQGYAKGKADFRTLMEWRAQAAAAEKAEREQEDQERSNAR